MPVSAHALEDLSSTCAHALTRTSKGEGHRKGVGAAIADRDKDDTLGFGRPLGKLGSYLTVNNDPVLPHPGLFLMRAIQLKVGLHTMTDNGPRERCS